MNCKGSFPGKYVLGTASPDETFILQQDFLSSVTRNKDQCGFQIKSGSRLLPS
jgi:hypothetical protein